MPDSFDAIATAAESAFDGLSVARSAKLEPLLTLPVPVDNLADPAWQHGVNAAKRLRTKLGIGDTDPNGATCVFERLGLDTGQFGTHFADGVSLTGAVSRFDGEAQVTLLQPAKPQRRFAAARAVFSAWTAETQEKRFLTSAVIRDQQASRAFAAELTAPLSFVVAQDVRN